MYNGEFEVWIWRAHNWCNNKPDYWTWYCTHYDIDWNIPPVWWIY